MSLKSNRKRFTGPPHPDRDKQFCYIQQTRQDFTANGLPIISVDGKKKELIGNFKNQGRLWQYEPIEVNAHDFASDAECKAVPYGIYDVNRNHGFVHIGTSADTPEFAVDGIVTWWKRIGQKNYPKADKILILADAGGSNGYRCRLFKKSLQEKLANAFNISVTVCHYPSGASKWNPVEHRLFGPISCRWAGIPLRSLKLVLRLLRTTITASGLRVCAKLTKKTYQKGIKVNDKEIKAINLVAHPVCPQWNYTIKPKKN